MIGGFAGFAAQQAHSMMNDPWAAIGILDDVVGAQNAKILMPLIAYSASKAQRGEKLAELASGSAGLLTFPTMTNLTTGALKLVAPTIGGPVAWLAVTVGGILFANEPNAWLRKSVFRSMRTLRGFDRQTRRLEAGGHYQDTKTAAAWRSSALREMSSTHQSARAYLGREAVLMQ
jgi:hypothetical protein